MALSRRRCRRSLLLLTLRANGDLDCSLSPFVFQFTVTVRLPGAIFGFPASMTLST